MGPSERQRAGPPAMKDPNSATGQPAGPAIDPQRRDRAESDRPPGTACVFGCAVCAAFGVLFAILFWLLVVTPFFSQFSQTW